MEKLFMWRHQINRDEKGNPISRKTLCGSIEETGEGTLVQVAEARCSPRDHFSRYLGRAISKRRLDKGLCYKVETTSQKFEKVGEAKRYLGHILKELIAQ